MMERLDFQLSAYIVVDILDTVMRFLILEISIRQITRAYVYKRENMGIKEMCILLVPSIVSWSEYVIGQYSQAFLETGLTGTAFEEAMGEIKSGNPVTDVILQEIKREAKRKGIHFQTDFYYPESSNINAFDVSIILHNGLQNGLEHAQGSIPGIWIYCLRMGNSALACC